MALKLRAHAQQFALRREPVPAPERVPVAGYLDGRGGRAGGRGRHAACRPFDARRAQFPLRDQSVAVEVKLPAVGVGLRPGVPAVEVHAVGTDHRAQTVEVEVRVARAHRLERPADEVAPLGERPLALRPLEPRAEAPILVRGGDGHHVRVADDLVAARGDEVVHEADEFRARERAEDPAARLPRDDQVAARREFEVGHPEHGALQRDARVELLDGRAFADHHAVVSSGAVGFSRLPRHQTWAFPKRRCMKPDSS
jgi:hypothetical protein